MKSLMLDPGHGGIDPGCVYGNLTEADIVLDICLEVERQLIAKGVPVYMTRRDKKAPKGATNRNDSLRARCEIANQTDADYYLSVHVNAFKGSASGAEIYMYDPKSPHRKVANEIIYEVGRIMGYHGVPIKDGRHLYVVRNTNMPAFLLELGYIDNKTDREKLVSYKKELANAIVRAIFPFLKG